VACPQAHRERPRPRPARRLLLLPSWPGAVAGVLVDRFDRRRLLIATQSLFIVAAAVMVALTWTGAVRVWMLFVVAS